MVSLIASPKRRLASVLCLAVSALATTSGCSGGGPATVTERLWISGVPKTPKTEISAFVSTRASDGKFIGGFFRGSAFRGGHDVFEWRPDGEDAANLTFLQDGKTRRLRFETCEPTTGFDHCIVVHGDPAGAKRYQSRKRWAVRKGRKAASPAFVVGDLMSELAEDDAELAQMFALEPTSDPE